MPGLHGQQLRVPLVRQGRLRLDIDRQPVFVLGLSPVPLVEFPDVAQHGVRLRVQVVQCQRSIRRLARRRECIVRCSQPEDAAHHVRFRQARPCIGAIGVAFDGLPKVIDRPSKVLHGSLAREVPRLQQRVANLWADHANRRRSASHRRDKPVASSWKGLDESWTLRNVTEHLAQAVDGFVDPAIEVDVRVRRPHGAAQLITRHALTGGGYQHRQNLYGLLLNAQLAPALLQLAGAAIELKVAEREG